MKNIDINDLLEKYWNAETSLKEEAQLNEYFNSDQVQNAHIEYKPLFQVFNLEKEITGDHINLHKTSATYQPAKVFNINKIWKSAAAILVLALASIVIINSEFLTPKQQKATVVNVEDPEEALEYTKMALAMVSKNYRKGTAELTANMDNLNKINIIK